MAKMSIDLDEDVLLAQAETGNKQWVARITGPHPQYTMDREFVAYQKPKTSDRARGTTTVTDGDIIERATFSHGGNETRREYFTVVKEQSSCELERLERAEVDKRIERMTTQDNGPESESESES